MSLKLVSVHGHGAAKEEYIILRVEDNCNLSYYIVADTSFLSSGTVSNKLRHMHWFIDTAAKKGDTVYLYTGIGKNTSIANSNGTMTHFRYWGLENAVWNDTGDAAMLFSLKTWNGLKAK